jgi:hypothetical protein
MNTNQIFSWNRFTATLRKELAENWRMLLLVTLGIYLWYTISMIISNVTSLNGSYSINPLFFTLIAAALAGMAFYNLKTRQGRVELLTSPSSTLEKYIVNLLLYFIGPFVIFAVSFQLADITRYLVMSFVNPMLGIESTLPTNLLEQFKTLDFDRYDIFMLVVTLGAGAAFFLSSVLWPRRSALKMGVVVLGIAILHIAAIAYISYQFLDFTVPYNIRNSFSNQLATVGIWFDAIVYILCLVMAWFVLKHKDVITLKWWK